MTFPVVYDVLMRVEIEALSPRAAIDMIAGDIAEQGIHKAVNSAVEIIRADNADGVKDTYSRHINGFAIFTSSQKLELVTRIAAALDGARVGNAAPGKELLAQLTQQFAYLDNNTLQGVQV